MKNVERYKRNPVLHYPERQWPNKEIEKAPIWCSVDLRDGNQALIEPMTVDEKVEMFQLLVKLGFKEIEIGFPAASQIEYDFLRKLVQENLIPDDVTVQVLTQAREHIIKKTFEAVKGAPHAVIHLYNSTSVAQREQVFKKDKEQIIDLAVFGAKLCKEYKEKAEGKITLEYSPESFTGTEPEFAAEICNEVLEIWQPTPTDKAIINLPVTVSYSMPLTAPQRSPKRVFSHRLQVYGYMYPRLLHDPPAPPGTVSAGDDTAEFFLQSVSCPFFIDLHKIILKNDFSHSHKYFMVLLSENKV